ncbi:MAG: hypothetical protein WBA77_01795 [Microcoleaceae cyanobacterium]
MEWKKPTSHVEENEAGIELQTECLGLCKIHDADAYSSSRDGIVLTSPTKMFFR